MYMEADYLGVGFLDSAYGRLVDKVRWTCGRGLVCLVDRIKVNFWSMYVEAGYLGVGVFWISLFNPPD